MRKILISLGGVATAVIALSGAWAVAERVIEDRRFWAKRIVETEMAGLRIEADQRTLRDIDDKIFKIQFELQRNPNSQYLRQELKKAQGDRERLQRKIDFQIQRGEK